MAQVNPFQPTSAWQRIFLLSKVNGAPYEEQQVSFKWPWPKHTYLQRRLEYLRTERTHGIWELRQAAQKDMADLDVVELGSVSASDPSLGTGGTAENPMYVDMPLDVWYWCADPTSESLSTAAAA